MRNFRLTSTAMRRRHVALVASQNTWWFLTRCGHAHSRQISIVRRLAPKLPSLSSFHFCLVRSWLCRLRSFACPTQRSLPTNMPIDMIIEPIERPMIKFRRITANASPPTKATQYSAGYDLRSAYDYTIPPKSKLLLATDLEIALPDGFYGRVAPRSGLALKNFIDVGGGVIDQDYRGPVGVILFNFGGEEFHVARGDRIAQLICEKICYPDLEEVPFLDDTKRGSGGFGSTGMQ